MKARRGFVSNSSSSSFIIPFKKRPESIQELKDLFFKDIEILSHPYNDTSYTALEVAETLFNDLSRKNPLSFEELKELVSDGYPCLEEEDEEEYPYPDLEDFRKGSQHDFESYEKAVKEYSYKVAKDIEQEASGLELYVVSYSDDTDYGCFMEHGPVFENIKCCVISNH